MSHYTRPAAYPCACGQPAAVEKAGRTVCAACAAALPGRAFPLRHGMENCKTICFQRSLRPRRWHEAYS